MEYVLHGALDEFIFIYDVWSSFAASFNVNICLLLSFDYYALSANFHSTDDKQSSIQYL